MYSLWVRGQDFSSIEWQTRCIWEEEILANGYEGKRYMDYRITFLVNSRSRCARIAGSSPFTTHYLFGNPGIGYEWYTNRCFPRTAGP
jgi:hypothetical protein